MLLGEGGDLQKESVLYARENGRPLKSNSVILCSFTLRIMHDKFESNFVVFFHF